MDPIKICKIFHIFFLVAWLGSLLVLPQMLRNNTGLLPVIRRIYRTYQLPSMILALCFGIALFTMLPKHMKAGWFHMKLTSVIALVAVDITFGRSLFQEKLNKVKMIILQALTVVFFLMSLIAVYAVRNKETELVAGQSSKPNSK